MTIEGTDLSTWQISPDQGVSWTTLVGIFYTLIIDQKVGPFIPSPGKDTT